MRVNEILKQKKLEVLFSDETAYDKKKKLNLNAHNKIGIDTIKLIEDLGVTSELIDGLGVEVLKYKTQITLHSDFSNLFTGYSFGYKSLIINKNKSLGIKYVAIDECKRKEIAKSIKLIGMGYHSSSTESYFFKNIILTEDTENFQELANLFNKIKANKELFTGNVNIYKFDFIGTIHIVLKMVINTIPQENVAKLIEALGVTKEMVEADTLAKENKRKEYLDMIDKRNNMLEDCKTKTLAVMKENFPDYPLVDYLKLTDLDIASRLVIIQPIFIEDYSTKELSFIPEYNVYSFYKYPNKRIIRNIIQVFKSLDKAIEFATNLDVKKQFESTAEYNTNRHNVKQRFSKVILINKHK